MRSSPQSIVSALSALTIAIGCETIIGADFGAAELRPPQRNSKDASVEGAAPAEAGGGGSGGGSACALVVPPPRPADLPVATDAIEFTVVVSKVDYGDEAPDAGAPAYYSRGFDLDGVCSGRGAPGSCTAQGWIGGTHTDGPGGQDDAVGLLMLQQIQLFNVTAISSAIVNTDVAQGIDAPVAVLRVQGYGGLSTDDHVVVDWFVAAPPTAPAEGGKAPSFDATDHWPIISTSVADPKAADAASTTSVYRDPNAFVIRNTLVAHFPRTQIPLRNVYFDLSDIVLTGKLHRDIASGVWGIQEGVIGARSRTDDLLRVIPEIAHVGFGVSLCTNDQANYPNVKKFICSSGDLPAPAEAAGTSPCVGTSLGASFDTSPAGLGGIVEAPQRGQYCPAGTDPAGDTCAVPPGE